jgi:hypothetical protein
MAKAGMHEGAISSSISSQVLIVTVGFGLPWICYIWQFGENLDLKLGIGSERVVVALVVLTVTTAVSFLVANSLPPLGQQYDGHQIGFTREGADFLHSIFVLAMISFVITEVIYEAGLGY